MTDDDGRLAHLIYAHAEQFAFRWNQLGQCWTCQATDVMVNVTRVCAICWRESGNRLASRFVAEVCGAGPACRRQT